MWFSTGGEFAHQETFGKSLETFLVVNLLGRGATGIQWVETRGAIEHLIKYRTASHNECQYG